jgi:hypothetical protein
MADVNVKVLVVGGGGSGGNGIQSNDSGGAGGGGGGGYQYNASYALSPGYHTVTVGLSDQNSSFGTITALAGGVGGSGFNDSDGGNGGCGGGGGVSGGLGAGGTGSQGYNGGSAYWDLKNPGGGGGAGQVGADGTSGGPGKGGDGVSNSITGSAVVYGGGGGGGKGGAGGSGGGGAGGGSGTAGTDGLGGGGGGAADTLATPTYGGAGGSGVVVVSYPTASFDGHTGGNETGTDGDHTWVKFTSSGFLCLGPLTVTFTPESVTVTDSPTIKKIFVIHASDTAHLTESAPSFHFSLWHFQVGDAATVSSTFLPPWYSIYYPHFAEGTTVSDLAIVERKTERHVYGTQNLDRPRGII